MCDLNRASGFLIAAKVALLAVIVMLGIAMANSASFFAAAANIPLMVAAIVTTGVATAMFAAALAELDRCASGPCGAGAELSGVRDALLALLVTMAVLTAALIAIAVVAAVPFGGAVAVGGFLAWFISAALLVAGLIELRFALAVQAYNACRSANGATTLSVAVIAIAYVVGVAAIVFSVAGGLAGKVPWSFKFDF